MTKCEKFSAYLPYGVYFGCGNKIFELTSISTSGVPEVIAGYSKRNMRPLINSTQLGRALSFSCKLQSSHLYLRNMEDCLKVFKHKGETINLLKELNVSRVEELMDIKKRYEERSVYSSAISMSETLRRTLLYYHFDIYQLIGSGHAKSIYIVNVYFKTNKLIF